MRFKTVIRIIVATATVVASFTGIAAQTERPYSKTFDKCMDHASTGSMLDCYKRESERWDRRLNAVYKELIIREIDPQRAIGLDAT